jgi:hypothetical protein
MAKNRFTAKETTVKSQLMNTMKKIEATSLKIEQDEFTGEVKVIFDRSGKRYTKTCTRWQRSLDNLRAIGLSIEYLYRAVEIYGVESAEEFNNLFNQAFIGIEATPDDNVLLIGNSTEWWEILGTNRNANKNDIINAYRSLAKIHHPDNGGNKEQFVKLRKAYDEGLTSL